MNIRRCQSIAVVCIALFTMACGNNFFDMSGDNSTKHYPGESSGNDALSASTNMSGKEGDTSPKLDPLSGAVYIPAPQIGNYGSVNISYPVQLPGGRAGMQPSVGLSYSSSGGDGLVGIGWSLSSGLPVIARTTSNGELYYDYRDTFTFNGKRLVKVSGPTDSEEGVYRCEIESDFSRYELKNASTGGTWYVMDKSGALTILGETSDSRVYRPDDSNKTYIWNFSRSYDLNGNYMEARYDTSDYEEDHILYLKEIRYGGNYNAGLTANQYVRFLYKDRDDAYVSKGAGFIMRMDRLLDEIVVGWYDPGAIIVGDSELWNYKMVYGVSEESERPLLSTIESNRHTTKPEFIYQKASHSLAWQKVNNAWADDPEIDPKTTQYFEGDFNGDGISDMLVFNPDNGLWKVAEGNRFGGYYYKTYGTKYQGYDSAGKIRFFRGNVSGDYNGDGRSDIAFYLPETREFIVAESNGRVLEFKNYGKLPAAVRDIFACEWFPGDYDGNGLSDAVLFDEKTGEWTLMRNMGGRFDFLTFSKHFKNLFRYDYNPDSNLDSAVTSDDTQFGKDRDRIQFISGDYNGDGRTDITVYDQRSGKWYIGENYRSNDSVGFRISWKLYRTFKAPEAALFANERFSGDFNGDGFSDFLFYDRDTGEFTLGDTGDGTIVFRVFCKVPSSVRYRDLTRWLQGDFNGDGKTDIGFYSASDGNFWIGEGAHGGFRFRVYTNISSGGPDGDRVLAKAPLPKDDIEIIQGRALIAGATSSAVVEYPFDGNYARDGGEIVFAGRFTASGATELLIQKKGSRRWFIRSAALDTELANLSALGIDLSGANTRIINHGRTISYDGSRDNAVYCVKGSSGGYARYSFMRAGFEGVTEFARISADAVNFDIDRSIYRVNRFEGTDLGVLFVEDVAPDGSTGSHTPAFRYAKGISAPVRLEITGSGGIADEVRDVLRGARSIRNQVRIFTKEGSTVFYLLDGASSAHIWYRGSISTMSGTVTFTKLSGTAQFRSADTPEVLQSRLYEKNNLTDVLVYSVPNGDGVFFYEVTLSSTVASSYTYNASAYTWDGTFDHANRPVVKGAQGYRVAVMNNGTIGYAELAPSGITTKQIERSELYAEVYPFQWIQGDYNGDGKTDIGFFHLKERQWYFAVTKGTVPDMLSMVRNGIGGNYTFTYENSSRFDSTGEDGLPHLPMNYKVCTEMTVDDGFSRRITTKYDYAKGYAFSGFINGKKETDYFGFSEFTVTDPYGAHTVNTYNTVPYDDFRKNRALAGAIKESRYVGSDGTEYSRTLYTYTLHEVRENSWQSPSYLIEPTKVEKYTKGTLTETRSSTIVLGTGAYEMISKTDSTTDHFSDGVHSQVTVKSYSEFSNDASTNEMRITRNVAAQGSAHEVTTDYNYDSRGNLVNQWTRYTGSGLAAASESRMRYEYDSYGNRVREINESESPYRITEKIFDNVLHQYVIEERALGDITLSTKYEINYASAFGAPQKKSDPNGWSVYYTYDAYGRIKNQKLDTDDGIQTLATYEYDAESTPISAKAVQNIGEGATKETRVFIDGIGRTLHSVWSATDESGKRYAKSGLVTYDAAGRVTRKGQTIWAADGEIDRYIETREEHPTVTEYDGSGRIAKVTLPPAFTGEPPTYTTYTYNDPWETTVTHSIGRSKRTVKNARGLVLYVEDSGRGDDNENVNAKIGFAYDLAGNRVKKMDINNVSMNTSINDSLFTPGSKDTGGNNVAQWRYDGFGRVVETSDPDLGYSKAEYDGFGQMIRRTDAKGRITSFAYDRLGRMTHKNLPGDEGSVTYTYDGGGDNAKGRLVTINDPSQIKRIDYDRVGRVKHEYREIKSGGGSYDTNFTYDLLGRTKTILYPVDPNTGERIKAEYGYCAYGVDTIKITQGLQSRDVIAGSRYNEFGQIAGIARGNETYTSYEYDVRGRLSHLVTKSAKDGSTIQNVTYNFRTDNSIASKEDNIGENELARKVRYEYSYDGLNRLVDAHGSYTQGLATEDQARKFHHAYAYAPNGNMTRKEIYDTATDTVDDRWTYSYENHAVRSINTTKGGNRFAMSYDDSGNMIHQSDATKNVTKDIEFDSNNRITKVTNPDNGKKIGEYWYDDQGFRVKKIAAEIENGEEKQVELLYPSMYFAIEQQRTAEGEIIAGTSYAVNNIYFNGIRVAASLPNGACQYYLTDQVDSVSIVMDDNASVVTRTEYLPYGETWFQEGNTNNRPKYNSQELDAETNFYFYNARYQDPEICRFVTADSVVPYEDDTQSWNRYSYCRNDPILYKDPTGHTDFTEWLSSMIKSDDDAKSRATHTGVSGDYAEDKAKSAGTNNTTQAKKIATDKASSKHVEPAFKNQVLKEGSCGTVNPEEYIRAAANSSSLESPFKTGAARAYFFIKGFQGGLPALITEGCENASELTEKYSPAKNAEETGRKFGAVAQVIGLMEAAASIRVTPRLANESSVIQVTKNNVALPPGKKIPDNLVESPYRGGVYGRIDPKTGKFRETLRIDDKTPKGKKGPNESHFHINDGDHLTDMKKWPEG